MFLKIVCGFVETVWLVSFIVAYNLVGIVSVIYVFCSTSTWQKFSYLREKLATTFIMAPPNKHSGYVDYMKRNLYDDFLDQLLRSTNDRRLVLVLMQRKQVGGGLGLQIL